MTNVKFNWDTESVEISGHAGYAPEGQDIVCAAASILASSLMGTVLDYHGKADVVGPGHVRITWAGCPNSITGAVAMALNGFLDLQSAYKGYVTVEVSGGNLNADE